MRESSQLLARVFAMLDDFVAPGITTMEIDRRVEDFIVNQLHAIQRHAEQQGYSVVREYCGHGIGREMHEAPQVLHYGRPGTGEVLREGMTFTIEPMINQGSHKTKTRKDGWTVVTRDKKLSAQWEHTVLVTADGFEVLTLRHEETV